MPSKIPYLNSVAPVQSVHLISDCADVQADLKLHCLHMAYIKCCLWQDRVTMVILNYLFRVNCK